MDKPESKKVPNLVKAYYKKAGDDINSIFFVYLVKIHVFLEASPHPDIFTTANTAYGTSEAIKVDVNEAYEVAGLHRNDTY